MGMRLVVGMGAVGAVLLLSGVAEPAVRGGRAPSIAADSAVSGALAQAKPPPADLGAGNLLVNPGFEAGFSMHGSTELVVGDGWTPWFDATKVRPEYKDEPYERRRPDGSVQAFSFRVFHGVNVQKFFSSSSTHDAGFYQQVRVEPGQELQFSIWAQSWTSDCDDPCISPREPCRSGSDNSHGTYRVQVGIDPSGGVPGPLGDLPPDTVQWSDPIVFEAYDHWFRLAVAAKSEGEFVTVFTRGSPVWPVKHNDSYWDDARLVVLGGGEPTATSATTATAATPTPATPAPTGTADISPRNYLPLVLRGHSLPTPAVPTIVPGLTDTPTLAPSATVGPTATPSAAPSASPSPTVTATAGATPEPPCPDLIVNGDFETGDAAGWQVGPAGAVAPEVGGIEVGPLGGDYSLRVGLTAPQRDMGPSWAWAAQDLNQPFVTATIQFDVRALSQDSDGGDWQMVAVRDSAGRPLRLLYWQPGLTSAEWQRVTLTLGDEVPRGVAPDGTPVRLTAEVYNDGDGAPSALFLDNVRFTACRPTAITAARPDEPVPPGADVRIEFPIRADPGQSTCDELAFESLLIRNYGTVPVTLGGWTLDDRAGNRFVFPPFTLDTDGYVRVWTHTGDDVASGHFGDFYWGRGQPVWDNDSDEAVIRDDAGVEVARRGYP